MKYTLSAATCAAAAMLVAFGAANATATNLLFDPGFESPITKDGPPFVGSWEGFNGANANSDSTPTLPLTGSQSLEIFVGDANSFAGAFQDIAALEGDEVTWSGWHALQTGSPSGGTEIRIEWLDAGGGGLPNDGNTTPVLTPDSTFVPFSVSSTAPAGTAFARLVYAVQSFGAAPGQFVFVDDVSATLVPAIPEPASLGLAALAGLALIGRRR